MATRNEPIANVLQGGYGRWVDAAALFAADEQRQTAALAAEEGTIDLAEAIVAKDPARRWTWTAADDVHLLATMHLPRRVVAQLMGRSVDSVEHRRNRLRRTLRTAPWSPPADLARSTRRSGPL